MKRTKIMLGFLLVFVLGVSLSVKLAEADSGETITIQSDGSVGIITFQGGSIVTLPATEYIKQEGNVYYQTQNIAGGRLVINCRNIVFDGQGYTINADHNFIYGGAGITLENVNNVTIKDVTVIGFSDASISVSHCSDITILRVHTDPQGPVNIDVTGCIWLQDSNDNDNKILDCVTGVRVDGGSGNTIYGNNVTLGINSPNNSIYYNNIEVQYYLAFGVNSTRYPIIGLGATFNRWDNGSVGNYWSDYTGVGVYELNENNTDHYPLTQAVPVPAMNTTPTVTLTPTIAPTPTKTPAVPEFSWLVIVPLLLSVFSVAVLIRVKAEKHGEVSSKKRPWQARKNNSKNLADFVGSY